MAADLNPSQCGEAAGRLSDDQIRRFHEDGFAGPFRMCGRQEMRLIKSKIVKQVLATDGFSFEKSGEKRYLGPTRFRHLDHRVVYDLCSHPAVVRRMACLFGPDLIVWKTQFFHKPPGGKALPWHQDYKYWPLDPVVNISAWIALDDATEENGCVQALPGSHKRLFRHVPAPEDPNYSANFFEMADPGQIEGWAAASWQMQAGEFYLFANPVHGSGPNRSPHERLSLVTRVTIPSVKVDQDSLFPQHRNLVISGQDTMCLNRTGQPPA